MSNFWAKFSEPLPSAPIKSNNASAIFGGHSPYGLRATEPSPFRPKEVSNKSAKERRKVTRSSSDVGLTKSAEKRRSRDLSSRRKLSELRLRTENSVKSNRPVSPLGFDQSDCNPENASPNNLDSSDSGESNSDRYPLFISVRKSSAGAEVITQKSATKSNGKLRTLIDQPSSEEQGQERQKRVKKSTNFSVTGAPSEPKPTLGEKTRVVNNQRTGNINRTPVNSLRREKSDIVVRPRGSPSSSHKKNSDLSKSTAALRREKSDITPNRSNPYFGVLKEKRDLVKPRGSVSPLLRRERSDVGSQKPAAVGKQQQIDLSNKKNVAKDNLNNSCETQENSRNKVKVYKEEMSKIPTPGSNPTSRIPSLSRTTVPPSRIPPKSKIPSMGKADKKDEQPKKSQIPSGIPRNEKSASKIPAPARPDSAKENKDPVVNLNYSVDEVPPKQNKNDAIKISRIPSAKNTSKMPSLPRQENQGHAPTVEPVDCNTIIKAEQDTSSKENETVLAPKSRIPSLSSSQQSSGAPSGVSKIPYFPKPNSFINPSHVARTPDKDETVVNISKIPQKDSLSVPSKESKIGITETKTSVDCKIPQFTRSESLQRSKIPGLPGSVLTRKLSEERYKKTVAKPAESPVITTPASTSDVSSPEPNTEAKVAPIPPPRQDVKGEEPAVSNSPMDKYIFSEAKRMEELLRTESIVVEVPLNVAVEDVEGKAEVAKLRFEKAPAVKELISRPSETSGPSSSDKHESTSPDKEAKEHVQFKTFGKKEDTSETLDLGKNFAQKVTVEAENIDEMTLDFNREDKVDPQSIEEDTTQEVKGKVSNSPQDDNKDMPAIDTLGQYEQQARRSRSRQRKVISPESEEADTTFEQVAAEEDVKKVIDKDKFGNKLFQGDETKDAQSNPAFKPDKVKSKHDKPKFVIESSLGADFYQSKTSQSKESITGDVTSKPSEVVVIQNKTFDDSQDTLQGCSDIKKNKKSKENSSGGEDVDLSSNKGSKVEMRAWSMEQLDEKTVKCSCGRGGKCSIM